MNSDEWYQNFNIRILDAEQFDFNTISIQIELTASTEKYFYFCVSFEMYFRKSFQ